MSEILICHPVASSEALTKLNLFPGRHLGETEFDRRQAYVDARLAPLLAGNQTGIIQGLEVQEHSDKAGCTLTPGFAVSGCGLTLGLFYPLVESWQALIEQYLADTESTDPTGVYYLTLKRSRRRIDADPDVTPCQRTEHDPTRDSTLVVAASLGLRKLSIASAAVTTLPKELIANRVAASRVSTDFLQQMGDEVPLALLAISSDETVHTVSWCSTASGRYQAIAHTGYRTLDAQVSEAIYQAEAIPRTEEQTLEQHLHDKLHLDYLPASGQLPVPWLQNPASVTPNVVWLPKHLHIDMVAVPINGIKELIERHQPRKLLELNRPENQHLRLLLAVSENDYQPRLLDFPQVDKKLHSDLYRYFMRAHNSWRDWMNQFHHLYAVTEADVLDDDEIESLDLPDPLSPPFQPGSIYAQLINNATNELPADSNGGVPYPYSKGVPTPPSFYPPWLESSEPPAPTEPTQNGLIIQFAEGQWELESLDNSIRAVRARLEKTRDYLTLQRQQLDSQTVSLASLAGGVAGDGSGLQVSRWLPFTKFTGVKAQASTDINTGTDSDTPPPPPAPPTAEDPDTDSSDSTTTASSAAGINYGLMLRAATDTQNTSRFVLNSQSSSNIPLMNISRAYKAESLFSNTLRTAPQQLSSLQYNLNASRLHKIANAPKHALTQPSFEPKAFRFGVLEHLLPELAEYAKAHRGMRELLTTLDGLFDKTEAKSIKAKLNSFGKSIPPEKLAEQDKEKALSETGEKAEENVELNRQNAIQARYEALFKCGQILTKQIAYMEGRYARIESLLEGRLRARVRQDAKLDKLAIAIEKATEKLTNIDKRRVEYLGDYGVTQRLQDEDLEKTYQENQERSRILNERLLGLYYVRARSTPVSMRLADPLSLRHHQPGDKVPGCEWVDNPDLPDALDDFFDAVLEVPLDDWQRLSVLKPHLPEKPKLQHMMSLRQARFTHRMSKFSTQASSSTLHSRLMRVRHQNESVLQQWSLRNLPSHALTHKSLQRDSAKVLSLEDVLSGTRSTLRRAAHSLRDDLENAISSLLDRLNQLPPSIRLQWGQLAEDDRINVEHVNQWPALDRAEREDFNVTRTVAELIDYWFRQLSDDVSNEGRAAMRNMIRGALIYASLGDPAEILHGTVQAPPRRLLAGEALRLSLNRTAKPGTILQLLNTQQQIVAILSIEDQDERGAIAKIAQVTQHNVEINTRFTVVASQLTQGLR